MNGDFRIEFERSGGLGGITLRTVVDSEQLPEPERSRIASLLDQVSAPSDGCNQRSGADLFQYDLIIDRDDRRDEITAYDGNLSAEQEALFRLLTTIARQ